MDLERGNYPQFRAYCMQNYYTDVNFTKHLAKPPKRTRRPGALHEDLRQSTVIGEPALIRSQTKLPIAIKGIQHLDDARLVIDNGADVLYCTNHVGRQANSNSMRTAVAARHRQSGRLLSPGSGRAQPILAGFVEDADRLCPARPSGSAVYTVYTNPVDAS